MNTLPPTLPTPLYPLHPSLSQLVIIHDTITHYRNEFVLGLMEWRSGVGMTFGDDPESGASMAYDLGRSLGEALSLPWDEAYCDHIYDSYCVKCGIDSDEEQE